MSLSVGRTKLLTALKTLHVRWDRTRRHWNDRVAKDFEKQFIAPLEGKVRNGVSAMEHMYQLVEEAKRDCA